MEQPFDMPLNGIALGRIALIVWHIVPTLRLPTRRRVRRQAAADRKDVRRLRDIARRDRGRLGTWHGKALLAQALQSGDRQIRLRLPTAIGGATRQTACSP